MDDLYDVTNDLAGPCEFCDSEPGVMQMFQSEMNPSYFFGPYCNEACFMEAAELDGIRESDSFRN